MKFFSDTDFSGGTGRNAGRSGKEPGSTPPPADMTAFPTFPDGNTPVPAPGDEDMDNGGTPAMTETGTAAPTISGAQPGTTPGTTTAAPTGAPTVVQQRRFQWPSSWDDDEVWDDDDDF